MQLTAINRWQRLPYLCLAYSSAGVGLVGAVLPLLPTTPFLLVAAWAAAKGSPRLEHWLHRHPRIGPPLRDWQLERALPVRAKVLACSMLLLSWVILLLSGRPSILLGLTAILFLGLGTYLVTRPEPSRRASRSGDNVCV